MARALSRSWFDRVVPWVTAAVVLGPLAWLVAESVVDDAGRLGLGAYRDAYGDVGRLSRLVLATLVVTGSTVGVAMGLGVPAGFLLARTDLPGRRAAVALVVGALLVPRAVLVGGALALAGHHGWLGTGLAQLLISVDQAPDLLRPLVAGVVQGLMMLPWAVLGSAVAVRLVEADLEDLGRLETSAPRVAWHVTLRRAGPGLVAVALVVVGLSFADVTVTDVLLVRTFGEEVFTAYQVGGRRAATATAWVPLVLGLGTLGPAVVLVRRWRAPSLTGIWHPGRCFRLARARRPLGAIVWLVLAAWWVPVLAALAGQAGRVVWAGPTGAPSEGFAWTALGQRLVEAVRSAGPELLLSLRTGGCAAVMATAVALVLAWHLRRRCPGGSLVGLALLVLAATPGAMLGVAWVRVASLHAVPVGFYDSGGVLVVVQALRALPVVCVLAWAAMQPIPRDLWERAVLDGAGPGRALWCLVVPLLRASVWAVLVVGLVLCLGELEASHLAVPPGTPTLTIRVYTLLHYTMTEHLAAVCLMQLAGVALLATGLAGVMMRRVR